MLRKKGDNYKQILQNFQDFVLQYGVKNYKKGVDLAPLIRKLEDVDLSSKEQISPTGTGTRDPT